MGQRIFTALCSFCFVLSAFQIFSQSGFTDKREASNEFLNNQKNGKWVVYFDDDWRETEKENAFYYRLITYRDGKPDGSIVYEFTINDKLVFEGKIIGVSADLYDGVCRWYFESGGIEQEWTYKEGKAEGLYKSFYANGILNREGNYRNNKADGLHKWYFEEGNIKEEWFYIDGKANGAGKTYYENGQLKSEGEYRDQKIHGKYRSFYENGKLWEESIYINDKKEGYKRYFDDGRFSNEDNFEDARLLLEKELIGEKSRGGGDPLKGLNVEKTAGISIGNYYALIIGIDKYNGAWNELSNAVNDAKAVEATLRGNYKFEDFHTLYNEQATRENIIGEFEWLMKNVKENDNLLVYYSGHGEYKKELNKGYWVPVDAATASLSKFISNSDLQTFLGGIKAKHSLLISDACFSGDIFRGNTISVPFEQSERYFKEVYSLISRQALTSGGLEPVTDGGKDGHSVFTYYLLKILNENTGKYFDAGQLYEKIKIPVANNSEQSPKFNPIKNIGDEGGQFIFIKK